MATSLRDLPTPDEERELHRRLMERDATAPSELAVAFLDHLVDWLKQHNSKQVDEHLLLDAAADSVTNLAKNPIAFQGDGKRSLKSYLEMSAQGDLRNALAKGTRRRDWEKTVEHSEFDRMSLWTAEDPAEQAEICEQARIVSEQLLPVVREGLLPEECECLELLLSGERKTEPFAGALHIEHLSADEQRKRVKQIKDMLNKRIERGRSRHVEES